MKDVTRDFVVGCVTLLALTGMAYLLMSFGELDAVLHDRYVVTVRMPHAAGVRVGSGVEYNRVPIGRVSEVRVSKESADRVEVVAEVDSEHTIPLNVDAEVAAPLIGGSAVLNLTLPRDTPPQGALARDGSATIEAFPLSLIDELTTELDRRLEPFVRSLEKVDALATTYNELGEDIRLLLKPQTEEELGAGAVPNFRTAIVRLNTTLDDARQSLALANEWLGDEELHAEVRGTVRDARALLDQTKATVERYRALADSLEVDAQTLVARFTPVADQIAKTLEEVRLVANRALEGPGTFSMLLNNPTLYLSLNDAAIRLEKALTDIQLLLKQVRAEGLKLDL